MKVSRTNFLRSQKMKEINRSVKKIAASAFPNRWTTRLCALGLVVSFLSACSTTAFKGSTEIDVSPFADNTRIMFGDAVAVSRSFQWKYLKPYTDIPEYAAIGEAGQPLKSSLRDIVYYSNQLIAIKTSSLSESAKNEQLALYIENALQGIMDSEEETRLQLREADVRAILADIRRADTFLNGVAAATPVAQSVALAVHARIDELQDMVPPVVNGINRQLDDEFGEARANYVELISLRDALMRSVTQLYKARLGDRAQLEGMLDENASLGRYIKSSTATPEQMDDAEKYLLQQLREIDAMLKQLDDAKEELFRKRTELGQWQTHVDNRLGIARNAVTVWAQSHQNLGNGVPVPPLIDLAAIATKLAGGVADVL